MCEFPHGDKELGGDVDGKLFIPAHGYVDGDGDGRAVMGTEMGLQYSPKKSLALDTSLSQTGASHEGV
jgi:hypothetical protein